MSPAPPLQSLVVTPGWLVGHHQFYAIDPAVGSVEDATAFLFTEDMYQARHKRADRTLDLGWHPEGDLTNGEYGLVLYAGDFRGELLRELRTQDREAVVRTMNEWFEAVSLRHL